MAIDITIPLSALNQVPTVSGVDDVVFEVPDEGIIITQIANVLSEVTTGFDDVDEQLDDIEDGLGSLDAIPGDVAEELDLDGLENLADDLPTPDGIAEEVEDLLDIPDLSDADVEIEGSLFSIAEDFEEILSEALDAGDLEGISQFPDLGSIEDRLDGLDIPSLDDIGDEVETAVENVFEGLPGGTLLTDPDQFIEDRAEDIEGLLVDPEIVEELEDALEDYEEEG